MRYKGTYKSKEINKAYERIINKVSKLSQDIAAAKEVSNVISLINSTEKCALIDKLNSLSMNSNIIDFKNITNYKNSYINLKDKYVTTKAIVEKKIPNDSIPLDMYVEAFDEELHQVNDINILGLTTNIPYIREYICQHDVGKVTTKIVVTLPTSINTNTICNFIEFDVFPFMSTRVINVEYSPVFDNRYFRDIKDFENHSGCTFSKYSLFDDKTGHIAFSFPDTDIKKIAITLEQSTPSIDEQDKKVFYLGISNLSVERRISEIDEFSFDAKFTSKKDGSYITDIKITSSGIIDIVPKIEVYKSIGSTLIKVLDDFEPFYCDFSDIVFRIIYPKSENIITVNEIKIISK